MAKERRYKRKEKSSRTFLLFNLTPEQWARDKVKKYAKGLSYKQKKDLSRILENTFNQLKMLDIKNNRQAEMIRYLQKTCRDAAEKLGCERGFCDNCDGVDCEYLNIYRLYRRYIKASIGEKIKR